MIAPRLTLTFAEYARLMPLATGDVRPEGIDLEFVRGHRPEMLRRAMGDPAIHGGEGSLAGHLRRIDAGDRSFVGLPIFVLRNFTARDLYIRKGSDVRRAEDLPGKRIGMYNWVASGSVWYRHFLRHIGVPLDSLQWWIGPIDDPVSSTHYDPTLAPGVNPVPEGRTAAEMLLAGDLDVMYSPYRPRAYDPVNGPIVRLFPDFRPIEREYYRATGVYPPQHLVILRREVWERTPWALGRLQAAFECAETAFVENQRLFPYASPWLDAELEATEALMGCDYHQHGFARNRAQLDIFCEQAHQAGLTRRRVQPEELFEEALSDAAR